MPNTKVFSVTSIIASVCTNLADNHMDTMPILYYRERADATLPLVQIAAALAAIAIIVERPRRWGFAALVVCFVFALGGQIRSGSGAGLWAEQQSCAERQGWLIEELRTQKLLSGNALSQHYDGDAQAFQTSRRISQRTCANGPMYIVDRVTPNGGKMSGVACAHRVMTSFAGNVFVLPNSFPFAAVK